MFTVSNALSLCFALALMGAADAFSPSLSSRMTQRAKKSRICAVSPPHRLGQACMTSPSNQKDIKLNREIHDRRGFFSTWGGILAALVASPSRASGDSDLVAVYFGCGCFWHVQHEMCVAEQQILGREKSQLTSRAGYAGGDGGAKEGKVCYHNAAKESEYSALGHAEVVSLHIPISSFAPFATTYCKLFNRNGYRPDQLQDRGSEYRNLVGIPGGLESPLAAQLVQASQAAGDKLAFAQGKGNDFDARGLVFIMDSLAFPFYEAEQYHQFHDGFRFGEDYPRGYNLLAPELASMRRLAVSKCPNGVLDTLHVE